MSMNATYWSLCGMGQYVAAVPYTAQAAMTGPYLWSNDGSGSTFARPSGAPGCRVGAIVGQFLMLADLYQQQQPTLFTGDGSKTSYSGTIAGPLVDGVQILDQEGHLAGQFSNGSLVGSGYLSSGTIDYGSGALTLDFGTAPPNADQVYALYTQVAPYRCWWSAIGDPTNWPTPLTNDALAVQSGMNDLEVDLGPVMFIGGYPLYGVVFQRFGITRVNYIGGNVVFSWNTYERKRGCIAHGAAVQVASVVYFLADDGFWATDGGQVWPIGTAQDNSSGIDGWFWANVNTSALEAIRAGYDAGKRCVFFAIPTGTNTLPDTLLAFNPLSGRWTRSAIACETLWTTDDGTDDQSGTRQSLGIFDQSHVPNTLSGAPLTGYLESSDVCFVDGNRRLTTGVRPQVASTDLPAVTVGVRNALQDPVTYGATTYPDAFSRVAPALSGGIYTRVRVGSTNASGLHGATLMMEQEGSV